MRKENNNGVETASLVAQLVKNLPAMWETWVRSLGWGDLLEMEKATHSSILAWIHRMTFTFTLERSKIWDWNMPAKHIYGKDENSRFQNVSLGTRRRPSLELLERRW